jgi:F-type H+-transporting ATPase subunit g
MQTVQTYLTPVTNAIRNPSSLASRTAGAAESTAASAVNNPQSFLTRMRNFDSATMVSAGIIGAETIGFFCVGEMIGRFKIIGYRGGHSEHH